MKRALSALLAIFLPLLLLSCSESDFTQSEGYLVYSETSKTTAKLAPDVPQTESAALHSVEDEMDVQTSARQTECPPVQSGIGGTEPLADDADIVYITPTGTKYHFRASCAGKSAIEKNLTEALADGYAPCKRCAS